jgi:hypothetical protein
VRPLAAGALAVLGAWLLLRRRGGDERRVVIGWGDGSELELRPGSAERERLLSVAQEALR